MNIPKKPPEEYTYVVLKNGYLNALKLETAECASDDGGCLFESYDEAKQWITSKLYNEPGDLYIICRIESLHWAEVSVNSADRPLTV